MPNEMISLQTKHGEFVLNDFNPESPPGRRSRHNSRLHHGDDPELPGFRDNL
jgi:hypothetical protein